MTDGMHVVVDALKRNGVDTIYGIVGIPVTDLARHAQEAGIRYIGFRHEQQAGNAAAMYIIMSAAVVGPQPESRSHPVRSHS